MERYHSRFMRIRKYWWFSLIWESLVGLFLSIVSLMLYYDATNQSIKWPITLCIGLMSGFVTYLFIEQLKERNLLNDMRNSFFEGRSSSLLRYFHALQNTTHFELALEVFDKLRSSRWVLSEFISWKLKTDFSSVSEIRIGNMDTAEYSRLLCALINVANNSIFMTCPYLPSIWLKQLKVIGEMTDYNMPAHFRAFLSKHDIDRIRILNLRKDKFQKLSENTEKPEIARFAKPVEEASKKRFLTKKKIVHLALNLDGYRFSDEQKEKWKLDYSIFDRSIVVVWRTSDNVAINRKGDCVLIFDSTEVGKYLALFDLLETDFSKFKEVSELYN